MKGQLDGGVPPVLLLLSLPGCIELCGNGEGGGVGCKSRCGFIYYHQSD
jgi:hypothetical protein